MTSLPRPDIFRRKYNWAIATAVELLLPVMRVYARSCSRGASFPRTQWRRVLITGANHLGDVLYRTSSLEALARGLPGVELHYLASPGAADLLQGNPAIKTVWPWMHFEHPLDLTPEQVSILKAQRYDAVLVSSTGRYWPDLLLALRLGVPNRVSYTWRGFSGWVTHPVPICYPSPYPSYFRDYVAGLTGQCPDWSLRPRLYPDAKDIAEADVVWRAMGRRTERPVLGCFMTTRQGLKSLPLEMFGRTLQELVRRLGCEIVLLGAEQDGGLLQQVNRQFALGAEVLAGAMRPKALSCFLSHCRAVVTTDSGPRHLANAAGVPVFFYRNLAVNCIETGAYLSSEVDLCPPGVEYRDGWEQRRIMAEIPAGALVDRIISELGRTDGTLQPEAAGKRESS